MIQSPWVLIFAFGDFWFSFHDLVLVVGVFYVSDGDEGDVGIQGQGRPALARADGSQAWLGP